MLSPKTPNLEDPQITKLTLPRLQIKPCTKARIGFRKNAKNGLYFSWNQTFEETIDAYFYPMEALELREVESFLCKKFEKSFAEVRVSLSRNVPEG